MTSTIRPTDTQTGGDLPEGLLGLPDYQERRIRAMWPDIPAKYRQSFLALLAQLPPLHPDLIAAAHEAERQGQIGRNQGSIRLLDSWLADDDPASLAEQRETWEQLEKHLAENRVTIGDW